MRFEHVRDHVRGVPFIPVTAGRYLYDLILHNELTAILELGVGHGTATCYMAAALDELGRGTVTAVDLLEAADRYDPSPETQVAGAGLERFVHLVRMETGYTWFLHDEIRAHSVGDVCEPAYDLCVIDGSKNWTIDACAFFLVDKLLKPGGWIIFDDYSWTYALADGERDTTDGITHRHLSAAERETPHVREIFELLVKQHPSYGEFLIHPLDDWAIARKCDAFPKRYTVTYAFEKKDIAAMALDGVMRLVRTASFRRLVRRGRGAI